MPDSQNTHKRGRTVTRKPFLELALLFISILLFGNSLDAAAGTGDHADSLRAHLASHSAPDRERVDALIELAYHLYSVDLSETKRLGEEAMAISDSISYQLGEGHACRILGIYATYTSDYQAALDYYKRALNIFRRVGDDEGILKSLANLGAVLSFTGDIKNSTQYHFQALEMAEKLNHKNYQAIVLNNIGENFYDMQQYSKALERYRSSRDILETVNASTREMHLATVHLNMANCYYEMGDTVSAVQEARQGLQYAEPLQAASTLSSLYTLLSEISLDKHDLKTADLHLKNALLNSQKSGSAEYTWRVHKALGRYFDLNGDEEKSLMEYQKAYRDAENAQLTRGVRDVTAILQRIYRERGDIPSAYRYLQIYSDADRQVNDEINKKDLISQSLKFDFEKVETEKQAEIVKQKIIIHSLSLVFFLILVFSGLLYRSYRTIRRVNKDLAGALAEVKTLGGLLPICSSCKKIRDDSGYWNQIEHYIAEHSDANFSHGICPDCMVKLYPEVYDKDGKPRQK